MCSRLFIGGGFGKESAKTIRTTSNVQEKNGKDSRLLEELPSDSTRKWNIRCHCELQR